MDPQNQNPYPPQPVPPQYPSPQNQYPPQVPPRKNKTGMIIGIIVAILLLCGCCSISAIIGIPAYLTAQQEDEIIQEDTDSDYDNGELLPVPQEEVSDEEGLTEDEAVPGSLTPAGYQDTLSDEAYAAVEDYLYQMYGTNPVDIYLVPFDELGELTCYDYDETFLQLYNDSILTSPQYEPSLPVTLVSYSMPEDNGEYWYFYVQYDPDNEYENYYAITPGTMTHIIDIEY